MPQLKRWKYDRKLTASMVDDMLFNPILACSVLLDTELPPHEQLRIMWMWTKFQTNDDSGFSTGKSWTFAAVSALRSILIPGRVSGILSKTFSQGKLIFANFDRWYDTNPIFRSCVKHAGGKKRLVHGNDVFVAEFRGGSTIRVLPPNFMQDAERIRSERWHDAYLDEWVTYGNFRALNTTIIGRVTNTNKYKNCPVRQNHIHLGSTPSFKHHPAYKMIKAVDHQVSIGNQDYGRFTCNWRHIPQTEKWDWLVNDKVIYQMQTNLPRGIVMSEIDGLWSDDSASFYASKIVEAVRFKEVKPQSERKSGDEVFVAGVDIAPGGSDNKVGGQGDDFAFSIFKLVQPEMIPVHALTIRYNRISDVFMSGIIHKYNRQLGLSLIIMDPGGGGLFLKDKLRNSKQFIDGKTTESTPIISLLDTSGTLGHNILIPFERSQPYIKQMWGAMKSDSVLVNLMHKEFKGAIENRKVVLAPRWEGWEGNESVWDVDAKRDWLNKMSPNLSAVDRLKAEMDLAVSQLILVDYERDRDGNIVLDSHRMMKFKSKEKKDAAYSLCYAHVGVAIYKFLNDAGAIVDSSDDKDSMACSMNEI